MFLLWTRIRRAQGRSYRSKQLIRINRLVEYAPVVGLGKAGQINVSTGGDENDWQLRTLYSHTPLQFHSVHARHSDVGDQCIDLRERTGLQESFRRIEQPHGVAGRLQQFAQGLENPRVVVHYRYNAGALVDLHSSEYTRHERAFSGNRNL